MRVFLLVLFVSAVFFWVLSRPDTSLDIALPNGNPSRGEYVSIAAGCASCHGSDYGGGDALYSPFGTFYAPNITPSHWQSTPEEFAVAMLNGVSPEGKHLYPAFPYSTYETMDAQDVADLYAYISSLPSVERASKPHELPFYARWRRTLGIWKHLRGKHPETPNRGAYLVETLGHCQECHTPRTLWGTLRYSRAFEGAAIYGAEGKKGKTPSLVTGDVAGWSESEIASYLSDGFTPEFDTAGSEMVEVIENTSRLSSEDRNAIAQYLKSIMVHSD